VCYSLIDLNVVFTLSDILSTNNRPSVGRRDSDRRGVWSNCFRVTRE